MKAQVLAALLCLAWASPAAAASEELVFPAEDGLQVTADLYRAHPDPKTPFIVLFHQAGWSRGEYREIAPKLVALGFNCMAVDQRAGDAVNDVVNETARRAEAQNRGTRYVDALPDLVAALRLARESYAEGPLIAWGSSYSASLVLRIAGEGPVPVDGALAFAPGEYFGKQGKPTDWVRQAAAKIRIPVFVTSARDEAGRWKAIFEAIPSPAKASYLPDGPGQHGSRALWAQFPGSNGYWRTVKDFLDRHFPRTP